MLQYKENGTGCSIGERRKSMMALFFICLLYSSSTYSSTNRHIPRPYVKIAESMEAQYVEFMLNKMKETVPKNRPDGPAMSYYRSLLTREQAMRLVQTSGTFGIKKMILDQIYPARLRNKTTYDNYQKMKKRKRYGKR